MRIPGLILILLTTVASGCVLADPAGNYPFAGPIKVINTDTGSPVDDADADRDPPDMRPPPPQLVFSEIMIDTSPQRAGLGESGEYVEIKNVGAGPADPTRISMLLSDPTSTEGIVQRIQVVLPATPEERQVVSSLQSIEPGDYFVFVRFEHPVAPVSQEVETGNFYDYGIYASGPPFANLVERRLELTYADPRTPEPFDVLRWSGGDFVMPDGSGEGLEIVEDTAIVLDSGSEDPTRNDDLKVWCLATETIGDGIALGTPGKAAQCP